MIDAIFFSDNNFFYSFKIKGHANYSFEGNDIVCAAVSSAVDMTINAIDNIINEDYIIDIDNLTADVFFELKVKKNSVASLFIKSLYNHLVDVSRAFPDNIKVKNKLREE